MRLRLLLELLAVLLTTLPNRTPHVRILAHTQTYRLARHCGKRVWALVCTHTHTLLSVQPSAPFPVWLVPSWHLGWNKGRHHLVERL